MACPAPAAGARGRGRGREADPAATRPLVIAGGGAIYSGAEAALDAFATPFGIPVSETQAGKGVLPWNHPMNIGPVGANGGLAANRLAREADLVISVGTRLGDFVTASKSMFQDPDVTFVGINVNGFDAIKLRAVPLVADAREALTALSRHRCRRPATPAPPRYRDRIADLKDEWDARVDVHRTPSGETDDLAQPEVIGIVNDAVGGHATVVCAAGSLPGDLLKLWRPEDSKAYHLEYGYSCMGYEIPAGLGVKLAEPEREVVVAIGDGTYLMLNTEIVTAVAEGIRITRRDLRQPRLPVHQGSPAAVGSPAFGNELRFRDPARTASPVATSRSTSRSTRSRWARCRCSPARRTSSAPPSPRPGPRTGSPSSPFPSRPTSALPATRAGGTSRSPRPAPRRASGRRASDMSRRRAAAQGAGMRIATAARQLEQPGRPRVPRLAAVPPDDG